MPLGGVIDVQAANGRLGMKESRQVEKVSSLLEIGMGVGRVGGSMSLDCSLAAVNCSWPGRFFQEAENHMRVV